MEMSLQSINPKLRHKYGNQQTGTSTSTSVSGPTIVGGGRRGEVVTLLTTSDGNDSSGTGSATTTTALTVQVAGTDEYGNTVVQLVGATTIDSNLLRAVQNGDLRVVEVQEDQQIIEIQEQQEQDQEQPCENESEIVPAEHPEPEQPVHTAPTITNTYSLQDLIPVSKKPKPPPPALMPNAIPSIPTVTPADLTPPTFPCPHCPRMFNRRNMVTRHINEIHKVELNFKCDLCDRTFSVLPSLQKHLMNTHDVDPEPYECTDCKDTFTLQSLLDDHSCPYKPAKTVTTRRQKRQPVTYNCNICHRKSFKTKTTLKRHVSSHFKCGYCRKNISSQENLQKHLKTHEMDVEDDEKEHQCNMCNKKYYVKDNLNGHMRVWHGEANFKPFGCERCDLRWTQQSQYLKHEETCSGKKVIWTCAHCSVEFKRVGDWKRHEGRCEGEGKNKEGDNMEVDEKEQSSEGVVVGAENVN